jgi:glyoxylase-like metal-dependent hydrolase (beta-lactamase superfamily II)
MRALALVVLAACGGAARGPVEYASIPSPIDVSPELTVRQVAAGMYIVSDARPYPANSLIAAMPDRTLVLVDTPYTPAETDKLVAWMKGYWKGARIVAVNTHFHPDRLGGNQALAAAGIPVYGSDLTVQMLRERGEKVRQQMVDFLASDPEERAIFEHAVWQPPDHVFPAAQGLRLDFGEPVQVIYPGPGHSPDNLVVWFPARKVLFGGCLVTARPSLGNTADADPAHWKASVEALRKYPAKLVIPGHGDSLAPYVIEHTITLLSR